MHEGYRALILGWHNINLICWFRLSKKALFLFSVLLSFGTLPLCARDADEKSSGLFQVLKEKNHLAIMRHALAPGIGDPGNFELSKCSTQRNLSKKGLKQAGNIGAIFRAHNIKFAKVYSSQWCRCLDTAKYLNLGPVHELNLLNSFFGNSSIEKIQTSKLNKWLSEKSFEKPTILVTHQVNITALTGIYPLSGEIIVLQQRQNGEIKVLGSIKKYSSW